MAAINSLTIALTALFGPVPLLERVKPVGDERPELAADRARAVMQASMTRITATRVVIAHALTSVRDIDRRYLLDHEHIVETGTYDEFIGHEATFAALACQLVHT